MDILEGIIDDKVLRVLKLFLNNPDEFYHINKVSEESKVPLATTFRIMNNLLQNKIIEHKTISKFRIYRLSKNQKTRKMRRLL
ncbi:hypothetical protein JXC34_00425 [Candidatus Woesearchaeota archaeon]|nr:hypothetical protein [Candidatus Woesearchaeota archaeon]